MNVAPAPPLPLLLSIAVPLAIVVVIAAAVVRYRLFTPGWLDAVARHRLTPCAVGCFGAIAMWFVWGSLREPGVIHDEQAYLLQAEIFSTGRWVGEQPPVVEFFEQTHVFVEPHLAAKYPPGHSILLIPGVLAGLPGLVPILFVGASGALFLTLGRRLADPMTALLAALLWATSTTTLIWRASYLSQTTSTLLWLASLWALLRWTESQRPFWLTMVAAGMGWLYLTRPLTGIALALPVTVVVLRTGPTSRRLGHVVPAAAVLAGILALQMLWQYRTVDDWRVSPYAEYSRQYFPFVRPGFGLDPTPPARSGPPEITWVAAQFADYHADHRVERLPAILLSRLVGLFAALGQAWRGFLVVLFVVAVVRVTGPVRFGVWSAVALLGASLIYAHPAGWVVYYAEVFPVFYLLAAMELRRLTATVPGLRPECASAMLALCLVVALPACLYDVTAAKAFRDDHSAFHRQAAAVLETLPGPAVVFVRYPEDQSHHDSLIVNSADYRQARLWMVYDRGNENSRLLQYTDRSAYRLDVSSWSLERLR